MKNFKINKISGGMIITATLILLLHLLLKSEKVLGKSTSIFYLDEEITLGAHFTTVASILVASLFFLYVSRYRIKDYKLKIAYYLTGLFFVFLSYDEFLSIHEYFNDIFKKFIDENELSSNLIELANRSWLFPLTLLVILCVVNFLILIVKETNKVSQTSFAIGLICFVLVLVTELYGGGTYGKSIYAFFVGIEEYLEMIGLSFFTNGILHKFPKNNDK